MKKRNWRGVSDKVAKDKAEIYNSREWKQLRIRKIQAEQGQCEMCKAEGKAAGIEDGYVTAANIVHHIHPIEDSTSKAEMRKWAFMWSNLMLVCQACHAKIHMDQKSHSKEAVRARAEQRHERWKDNIMSKFIKQEDNGIQTEIHEGFVRESSTDRTCETQTQANAKGNR